jgi:hypothetical protein
LPGLRAFAMLARAALEAQARLAGRSALAGIFAAKSARSWAMISISVGVNGSRGVEWAREDFVTSASYTDPPGFARGFAAQAAVVSHPTQSACTLSKFCMSPLGYCCLSLFLAPCFQHHFEGGKILRPNILKAALRALLRTTNTIEQFASPFSPLCSGYGHESSHVSMPCVRRLRKRTTSRAAGRLRRSRFASGSGTLFGQA